MADITERISVSRRHFLRQAGVWTLGSSPLAALGALDTSEGVTFADGHRPLVKYPGKLAMRHRICAPRRRVLFRGLTADLAGDCRAGRSGYRLI